MDNSDYKQKYIKYKQKYCELKKNIMLGGAGDDFITINPEFVSKFTDNPNYKIIRQLTITKKRKSDGIIYYHVISDNGYELSDLKITINSKMGETTVKTMSKFQNEVLTFGYNNNDGIIDNFFK